MASWLGTQDDKDDFVVLSDQHLSLVQGGQGEEDDMKDKLLKEDNQKQRVGDDDDRVLTIMTPPKMVLEDQRKSPAGGQEDEEEDWSVPDNITSSSNPDRWVEGYHHCVRTGGMMMEITMIQWLDCYQGHHLVASLMYPRLPSLEQVMIGDQVSVEPVLAKMSDERGDKVGKTRGLVDAGDSLRRSCIKTGLRPSSGDSSTTANTICGAQGPATSSGCYTRT